MIKTVAAELALEEGFSLRQFIAAAVAGQVGVLRRMSGYRASTSIAEPRGTTHIVLEPLDLMARRAALVPPPRMHLTRFLSHLERTAPQQYPAELPLGARAPPAQASLPGLLAAGFARRGLPAVGLGST